MRKSAGLQADTRYTTDTTAHDVAEATKQALHVLPHLQAYCHKALECVTERPLQTRHKRCHSKGQVDTPQKKRTCRHVATKLVSVTKGPPSEHTKKHTKKGVTKGPVEYPHTANVPPGMLPRSS
jgi:hypothetical protein